MLILSNEDIESFLSIKTCITALENAYRSWDKGTAINRPRTDLVMPSSNEAGVTNIDSSYRLARRGKAFLHLGRGLLSRSG